MEEKEGNGVFSAPSPAAASVVVAAQAQARATDVSEDYVQLHSGDDHVFYVLRDVALGSKTIENNVVGKFSGERRRHTVSRAQYRDTRKGNRISLL